jgi:hypothetical protein
MTLMNSLGSLEQNQHKKGTANVFLNKQMCLKICDSDEDIVLLP